MSSKDDPLLREKLKSWRLKFEIDQLQSQHEEVLEKQKLEHRRELENAVLQARVQSLEGALAGLQKLSVPTPSLAPSTVPEAPAKASVPMLKDVVDAFIESYPKTKPEMLKKHRTVLPVFLEVVGNRPVNQLKQAHIKQFFELICRLPARWKDIARQKDMSIREVANLNQGGLSPQTFDDTYKASIRPFLEDSIETWQDQGFPSSLTASRIKYTGDRDDAEDKQRAFRAEELKRLFEGEEMKSFARNASQAHQFWLPLIGLFTGARVNEICQINPQVDVLQNESQIWYFLISDKTEADPMLRKSVKTGDERAVPIHQQLVDLGLLNYIDRIKKDGAKRLFPAWKPVRRRASGEAEKWFREFLKALNLRDETKGARLVGMHAFRHTLLTYGKLQKPPLTLTGITGHAQKPEGVTGAAVGYFDMTLINNLPDLKKSLDQLDYKLSFPRPV